jgi:hypothetical protein
MTLTPERLAQIREREQAATPGPWDSFPHSHIQEGCRCLSCQVTTGWELRHQLDCEEMPLREPGVIPADRCESSVFTFEDAEFAAHARTDVPDLLDEIDRVRPMLRDLRNDASDIRGALSPNGEDARVPMPLGDTLLPAVEWLLAENDRLTARADRVREIHVPVKGRARCHHSEHDDDNDDVIELDDGTETCSTTTWTVCSHCCVDSDGGELSDACEPGKCWPCPTLKALDGDGSTP